MHACLNICLDFSIYPEPFYKTFSLTLTRFQSELCLDRIILGEPHILSLRLLLQTLALHGLSDVILKFLCLGLYLSDLHLLAFSLSILTPFFFDLCLLPLLGDLYLCLALSMLNLFDISLYFLVTFLGLRSLENMEIFKV